MNEPKKELEQLLPYYPEDATINAAYQEKNLMALLIAMHNVMTTFNICSVTFSKLHPMIHNLLQEEKDLERKTQLND